MFRAFKSINDDSYVYLRQSDNVIVYLIEAFTEFPEILQFPTGLVHDDFNGTLDLSFKHATQCNKKESYKTRSLFSKLSTLSEEPNKPILFSLLKKQRESI